MINNQKMNNVILVGFSKSSVVAEFDNLLTNAGSTVTIVEVDDFVNNKTDPKIPHLICVSLDLELRKTVIEHADKYHYSKFTYIDSSAIVADSAVIEPGCFIGPFCFIGVHAKVYNDVIIAPYSMVNHYSKIGRGTILHPNTVIAGSTNVGEFCRFSLRSTAIDHLNICNGTQLGAGALLTKNTTDAGRYLGNPARKIVTPPACYTGDLSRS
jgi:UDP-3-O-[3-hydroxymyristoyl] glucosamine N-acyltransferase